MDSAHVKRIALVAAALLVWLVNPFYFVDMLEKSGAQPADIARAPSAPAPTSSPKVSRALACSLSVESAGYDAGFENPFRPRGVIRGARRRRPRTPRPQLALQGILLTDEPLAIIEDKQGTTSIVGAGDEILQQKVVKIDTNRIVLRDGRGTYEVSVPE